jgi:hypothetical protein
MRSVLIALALCAVATAAFAECPAPAEETISAFGHTFKRGGALGSLNESNRDCDATDQPAWLVKMNQSPPAKGTVPQGLLYCRQIVHNKDLQYEAQRKDCIFWYGHSIEAQ